VPLLIEDTLTEQAMEMLGEQCGLDVDINENPLQTSRSSRAPGADQSR
jgi:hypothetical protein